MLCWLSDVEDFTPPPLVVTKSTAAEGEQLRNVCSASGLGVRCYPSGNEATGTAWLTRKIFLAALLDLVKYRDKKERGTGVRAVCLVLFDRHTIHELDPTWIQNKLEAVDVFPLTMPAGLTWIAQPVDVSGVLRTIKATARERRWSGPLLCAEFWDVYGEAVARYSNPETFARLGLHRGPVDRGALGSRLRAIWDATETAPPASPS